MPKYLIINEDGECIDKEGDRCYGLYVFNDTDSVLLAIHKFIEEGGDSEDLSVVEISSVMQYVPPKDKGSLVKKGI